MKKIRILFFVVALVLSSLACVGSGESPEDLTPTPDMAATQAVALPTAFDEYHNAPNSATQVAAENYMAEATLVAEEYQEEIVERFEEGCEDTEDRVSEDEFGDFVPGAELQYCDFGKIVLFGFDLSGADLTGINFRNADLRGVKFNDAILTHADLTGADLSGADFTGAVMDYASMRDAVVDHATRLTEKTHRIWAIQTLGAEGADMRGWDLSDANLSGTKLKNANLSGAVLTGTNFTRANMEGVDLSGAELYYADLENARLDNALFLNTFVDYTTGLDDKWYLVWDVINHGGQGRDFSRMDLSKVNWWGADLSGCLFVNTDFSQSILEDVNFSNSNLNGADFTRSIVRSANFAGAELSNADLRQVNAQGANFLGASVTMEQLDEVDTKLLATMPSGLLFLEEDDD